MRTSSTFLARRDRWKQTMVFLSPLRFAKIKTSDSSRLAGRGEAGTFISGSQKKKVTQSHWKAIVSLYQNTKFLCNFSPVVLLDTDPRSIIHVVSVFLGAALNAFPTEIRLVCPTRAPMLCYDCLHFTGEALTLWAHQHSQAVGREMFAAASFTMVQCEQ